MIVTFLNSMPVFKLMMRACIWIAEKNNRLLLSFILDIITQEKKMSEKLLFRVSTSERKLWIRIPQSESSSTYLFPLPAPQGHYTFSSVKHLRKSIKSCKLYFWLRILQIESSLLPPTTLPAPQGHYTFLLVIS